MNPSVTMPCGFDQDFLLLAVALRPMLRSVWWISILPIPVLLLGYHYRDRLTSKLKWAWTLLAVLFAMGLLGIAAHVASSNIAEPPQWDFQLYWLLGRAAAVGVDPYDTESLRELARPLNSDEDFLAEVLCVHPPPSLLLYAPLGWFDIQTACFLWYVFHAGILVLDVFLLWRLLLREDGPAGLLLTVVLLMGLRASLTTVVFAQVSFLLLLLFLLFWRSPTRFWGGFWLGAGIFVKPVLAPFALWMLPCRHWRGVAGVALACGAACTAAILMLGWDSFFAYFTHNPLVYDMPDYYYTEVINQSLLATMLRWTGHDLTLASPYSNLPFILSALVLTAATVALLIVLPRERFHWGLALLLVLCLLLFPKTLTHYAVLLVVPVMLTWSQRDEMPGGAIAVVGFATLTYVLVGAKLVFWAMLLNWLVLAAVAVRLARPLRKPVRQIDAKPPV